MSSYFYILLASFLPPFLLSFDRKVAYYRRWGRLFPAMLITMLVFIPWDVGFARAGIWGFNSQHLSGLHVLYLPVEEWLFFLVIPYASVFTMDVIQAYFRITGNATSVRIPSLLLILGSVILMFAFHDRAYTFTTFLLLPLLVALNQWILRSSWLPVFYVSYLVILVPFMAVNGLLTGTLVAGEIVWYNDMENMGLRIATIPFEDIFYGFSLMLLNVTLYRSVLKKGSGTV